VGRPRGGLFVGAFPGRFTNRLLVARALARQVVRAHP